MKQRFLTPIIFSIFAFIFIFNFELQVHAKINNFIAISVNDRLLSFKDVSPFVEQGTTYAPIRSFAESLGVVVHWNRQTQEVQLSKEGNTLILQLDKQQIVTDTGKTTAYSMKKVNDRIVAPYRFIAEYFGFSVHYDQTIPFVRVIDSRARLTHEQFVEKYRTEMIELKQQFIQANQVKKYAYLTFDDGPNQYTSRILDILQKYDSKATFFMIDGNIRKYQNAVVSMVEAGHSVGCHGVTHDKAAFYQSPTSAYQEMNQCLSTLKEIGGSESVLIRVPYGSKPYMTEPYRQKMAENGYKVWDWNIDSLDWKFKSGTEMVAHVKKQISQLEKQEVAPVILFHERQGTVNELEEMIVYLKNEGYHLLPLTAEMTSYDFWNRKVDSLRRN